MPGYNLVEVRLTGSEADRELTIAAHLRQWQSNPDQFRPMLTAQGETVFRHTIAFPDRRGRAADVLRDEPASHQPEARSAAHEPNPNSELN